MLEFEEYKVKLNNLKPELEELYTSLGLEPVSYTHLDVYKRQVKFCTAATFSSSIRPRLTHFSRQMPHRPVKSVRVKYAGTHLHLSPPVNRNS